MLRRGAAKAAKQRLPPQLLYWAQEKRGTLWTFPPSKSVEFLEGCHIKTIVDVKSMFSAVKHGAKMSNSKKPNSHPVTKPAIGNSAG